jgi:hypothetical protein
MNKPAVVIIFIAVVTLTWVLGALAKERRHDAGPPFRALKTRPIQPAPTDQPRRAPAASDTTWLGVWDFDGASGCDPKGWTSVDITAQMGNWTHVDDFSSLGGGSWGLLTAPEGAQAMWCGVRPDYGDSVLCGYVNLPGYGNNWDQGLRTVDCVAVSGDVTIDFLLAWSSEPGWDHTYLEYDTCDNQWTELAAFTGNGSGFFTYTVPDTLHAGTVRFRFRFDSDGNTSDATGEIDSDGAFIVDSLTVRDAGGSVLATELFETESVGDQTTVSGNWEAFVGEAFGDFAGLFQGRALVNEDPCYHNPSCVWGFFSGSTYDYSCGGFPGQPVVPYGNERGQVIQNEIWSPVIPLTGSGDAIGWDGWMYYDEVDPLILGLWKVRSFIGDCPLPWQWNGLYHFSPNPKIWGKTQYFEFGDMIAPGATAIQLAIGVEDICPWGCGVWGSGECHNQWPLIEEIRMYSVDHTGPQWINWTDAEYLSYRFLDNFSADGTVTGTARADMAADVSSSASPTPLPGDSAVVAVGDHDAGLATDPYTGTGPAVYAYVSVFPQGQPGKSGSGLSDDPTRWPVVDSLSHDGATWYVVRMDTVFASAGRQDPVPDQYCVDLNDNLFTPGDTVFFAFGATSAPPSNVSTYLTFGVYDELAQALDNPDEFTILPAAGAGRGGDILWVNKTWPLSGHSDLMQSALELLGIAHLVDRYDARPSIDVGGSPGARVVDVSQQLAGVYRRILWSTGQINFGTISDGFNGKPDDATMLYEFLHLLPDSGGVYFSGDRIADEWSTLTGAGAVALRGYLGYSLTDTDHNQYGLGYSPFVIGEAGSPFEVAGIPDTLVAYGGCLELSSFDVIDPSGTAALAASYSGRGSVGGAVVAQTTANSMGKDVRAMIAGFGFGWIRDHAAQGVPARSEHLGRILNWLGGDPVGAPVGSELPEHQNSLSQNYPNPFNPTTTIVYTVRRQTPVTLRVYNVAGALVRTLVDGVRSPGIDHKVEWDGRNAAGQAVASGVYFYRLVAGDYTRTRKMVLLK